MLWLYNKHLKVSFAAWPLEDHNEMLKPYIYIMKRSMSIGKVKIKIKKNTPKNPMKLWFIYIFIKAL